MALVVLGFLSGAARAQEAAPGVDAKPVESADLVVANRRITTLRARVFDRPPAERVRVIESVVPTLVDKGGPLEVTTAQVPEGVAVLVDGALLFRVLDGDVNRELGETTHGVGAAAAQNLATALAELREARDTKALLPALGHSLLATLVAAVSLALLLWAYSWLSPRLRSFIQHRIDSRVPGWSRQVIGARGVERVLMAPLKLFTGFVALLIAYEWLAFVLGRFPYTRPWGEALLDNLFDAVSEIASGIASTLPDLFFVAVIFYLTRLVARLVRAFFGAVEAGRIPMTWVDPVTARPTAQLITAVVWLFGLVAAYPYIPGSGSEAFKGIGVFVGLMLSIGSSGIVNQAVSGLMLMYTRALRPGEFVQIGDTEGTVRSVGFVNTRIETVRHEEISIPNAVIAATVTRNFSRLAGDGGVRIPTKLTIGYDTPWRQVRAMLLIAAGRTSGVAQAPEPRVLQSALMDFYVEYTLTVSVAEPARRNVILDELHAHIQDVFNEHGVQIMSPNYEADPPQPKIVPREDWFKAPAEP